jgi:DNA-binding IclR family transcriptional regulator
VTANTITDRSVLVSQLRTAQLVGCAVDAGEAVTEVHGIAAPVRDDCGALVATTSLMAPANRLLPRSAELKRAVTAAAADLSARLAESKTRMTRRERTQNHHGSASATTASERKPPA